VNLGNNGLPNLLFLSYCFKELITRIYRGLKIPHRINMNKWEGELSRQFTKEVQMANKYMKKCSTTLDIQEIQIHSDFTSLQPKRLSSRTQTATNVGEDAGKKELPYTVGGDVK
jgi:hypothetical protein